MLLKKWDELPSNMRCNEVYRYYVILSQHKGSLALKRAFDVVASIFLMAVLSPLFLIISAAIAIDSPGGVFFRQTRITRYGKRFKIFKFRTMVKNAEEIGPQITKENDDRVTRIGRILRDYRLDEIPQLLNILWGDMTFVGTRPEVPKYVERYTSEMLASLLLPAGVTSEASILYKDESELLRSADDVDKMYIEVVLPAKMFYNLRGIKQFGFWHDIRIILKTILAVCGKDYSKNQRSATDCEKVMKE